MKPKSKIHRSGFSPDQLPALKSVTFTILAFTIQFAFFCRTLFMKSRRKTLFMSRSISAQPRSRHW